MSIRFSEITLSIVNEDGEASKERHEIGGHPCNGRGIRDLDIVKAYCAKHPAAEKIRASVIPYVFKTGTVERDADDDHIKLINLYEALAEEQDIVEHLDFLPELEFEITSH